MKVGFDAKRALLNETGLGVYSRNLINGLTKGFPENKYFLFAPTLKEKLLEEIEGSFLLTLPELFTDRLFQSYWRGYTCVKDIERLRLDIYHGLSNELPFSIQSNKQVRKIVTIHDLIFMKEKSQYPLTDRLIYEYKIRHACKTADKIIAISNETKSDLCRFFGVSENKIEVIYQSCDAVFSKDFVAEEKVAVKEKYNLPENFILNVSSFFPRKNQMLLIKAFEKIKAQIPQKLVLVGGHEMERKKIEQYISEKGLGNYITILSAVPKIDLAILYQLADLFVYPSKFEGFGIPVLEAMTSGTAVLASNVSCFREIGADTILYFNENNVDELAESISINTHKNIANTDAARVRSRNFSIENFSKKTIELYSRA